MKASPNASQALLLGAALALPVAVPAQDDPTDRFLPSLEQGVRQTSADTLQQVLYDLIALRQNTHQAHWNVVGSDYYQLHEFYSELYTGLAPYIDTAAERIRVLGPAADGRLGATAEATGIETIPTGELQGATANETLAGMWHTMSDALYDGIETVSDDPPTQDLLIATARFVDVSLWQLRAHLAAGQ